MPISVTYRTSAILGDRGGARNRYARCQDIEFFAFPHQSYYARVGEISAIVGSFHTMADVNGKRECVTVWSATIYSNDLRGRSSALEQQHFTEDRDAAFVYAATQIKERSCSTTA